MADGKAGGGSKQSGQGIEKKSLARGQTIMTSWGKDGSSHSVGNARGGSFGGGKGNLSHSIKGGGSAT